MVSTAPRPTAAPMAKPAVSAVTCRRAPLLTSTAPITVTSMPTVLTSHLSTLGPVTASNDRMCSKGHNPVAAKYRPWVIATLGADVLVILMHLSPGDWHPRDL